MGKGKKVEKNSVNYIDGHTVKGNCGNGHMNGIPSTFMINTVFGSGKFTEKLPENWLLDAFIAIIDPELFRSNKARKQKGEREREKKREREREKERKREIKAKKEI